MNKYTLISASVIFALIIIFGLTYAGVRGENNNAITTVKSFITDIKEKKYTETKDYYTPETKKELFKSDEDLINFHFMLELSLLNYFDLLENKDYSFDACWNQLWIPYGSSSSIKINLTFHPKDDDPKPWSYFLTKKNSKQIMNLITMERIDGLWKISDINVKDESIANYYNQLYSEIQSNKYVTVENDGFTANPISVKTSELTELEKRIMKFNLQKMILLLEQ